MLVAANCKLHNKDNSLVLAAFKLLEKLLKVLIKKSFDSNNEVELL